MSIVVMLSSRTSLGDTLWWFLTNYPLLTILVFIFILVSCTVLFMSFFIKSRGGDMSGKGPHPIYYYRENSLQTLVRLWAEAEKESTPKPLSARELRRRERLRRKTAERVRKNRERIAAERKRLQLHPDA